jgi:23S rRNA (cytosine1962-C5)-methyltransferase
LTKGREWQLAHGHPWLFSGAISQAPNVTPGALVDVVDVNGKFIARGYYNPGCDIAVRVLSRNREEEIDRTFFEQRIKQAIALRDASIDRNATNVYRLINAEGDFLPGYIVDYYAGVLVVQSHTAGGDLLLDAFIEALDSALSPAAIIVRNDASVRKREGLQIEPAKVVRGQAPGELTVHENNLQFVVDPMKGQKTGFFTDQRDKRSALQRYALAAGAQATMANCFSYSGSFSVYAAAANRHIQTTNVDESPAALDQAYRNFAANQLNPEEHEFVATDAFKWLDEQQQAQAKYDFVIVDPPAFAKSHKDKARALKAYKRMDKLALAVTKSGGMLITCSCSGSVSLAEFEDALKEAAQESKRSVQIVQTFRHGADHPVSAVTPEANYLKVLFCRVL